MAKKTVEPVPEEQKVEETHVLTPMEANLRATELIRKARGSVPTAVLQGQISVLKAQLRRAQQQATKKQ